MYVQNIYNIYIYITVAQSDGNNYSECERLASLGIMGIQWRLPWNPLKHHSTMVSRGLGLSDSWCQFLQYLIFFFAEIFFIHRLSPLSNYGGSIVGPPQTPRYNIAVMFEGFQGRAWETPVFGTTDRRTHREIFSKSY